MSLTRCTSCGSYGGMHSDGCAERGSFPGQVIEVTKEELKEVISCTQESSAFSTQVGGSHYKQYKIQPYEFFYKNNIPHHKAAIIRRILRYDHSTGKGLTDLEKIKHEVDLIIELSGLAKS